MIETDMLEVLRLLDEAGVPGREPAARLRTLIADYDRMYDELEARRQRTDRARMIQSLDEDRSELLMVLADLALDADAEDESKGWRWLAMGRKWPTSQLRGWRWFASSEATSLHGNCLPSGLWQAVYEATRRVEHPTQSAALLAVVDAFVSGQWPPKKRVNGRRADRPTSGE